MIGPPAQYQGDEWMSERLKKLGFLRSLHEVYGILHGCMAAPQMTMPSQYLSYVFGEDSASFETEDEANEFVDNLMALWNRIAQWNPETEPIPWPATLHSDTSQGLRDRISQHDSFINYFAKGLNQGGTQESDFNEDALSALKSLFEAQILLNKYADSTTLKNNSESFELIEKFEDIIADCLARINIGLKPARMHTAENMRASRGKGRQQTSSNKIGRNEPCPCGSGKKYKKCCGLLH